MKGLLVFVILLFPFAVFAQDYLKMTANSDSRIAFSTTKRNCSIDYSLDGGKSWNPMKLEISLSKGKSVVFRGLNYRGMAFNSEEYSNFRISGDVELSGDIMTLIDYKERLTVIPDYPYCFFRLFSDCTGITSVSENLLPATQLANRCYAFMFSGCSNLKNVPQLPAKDLAFGCYSNMFAGCESIIQSPILPAHTLKHSRCYEYMFYNCRNLSKIEVHFTDWNSILNVTNHWVDGVSDNGVFVCSNSLDFIRGVSFIPFDNTTNWVDWHASQLADFINFQPSVYPNPAKENDYITISLSEIDESVLPNVRINVFNSLGQKVLTLENMQSENNIQLNHGSYICELVCGNVHKSFKVLVVK